MIKFGRPVENNTGDLEYRSKCGRYLIVKRSFDPPYASTYYSLYFEGRLVGQEDRLREAKDEASWFQAQLDEKAANAKGLPKGVSPGINPGMPTKTTPKLTKKQKQIIRAGQVEVEAMGLLLDIRQLSDKLKALDGDVVHRLGEMLEDVHASAYHTGEDAFGEHWTFQDADVGRGIRMLLHDCGHEFKSDREIDAQTQSEESKGEPSLRERIRLLEEIGAGKRRAS